jgi:GT2 family glycosyltransferase
MDLSIIIVNFETFQMTQQTIKSVLNHGNPFSYDIYVVDNASEDGSFEELQKTFAKESEEGKIKFIQNSENGGFAQANNLALKRTNSEYVLLLNSDTVVVGDCLEKSMNYMKNHPDTGILGCKVLLPDGTLDKACRRSFPEFSVSFYRMTGLSKLFPKSGRFGRYNLTYLDEDETYEVDCVMGAFMLLKSSTIDDVGLLDEKFFMYGEDIDWCYRTKTAGWKVIYYSEAEIIHYKGSSNTKKQNKRMIHEFYRAMYIFYNKHYKENYPWITTLATYMGIWSLCQFKLFKNYITR